MNCMWGVPVSPHRLVWQCRDVHFPCALYTCHHTGYVTSFMSCNRVIGSSVCSLGCCFVSVDNILQVCKMMLCVGTLMCCLLPAFYHCQYQLDNLEGGRMQMVPVCGFQAWRTGILWVKIHQQVGKEPWLHLEPTPFENKRSPSVAL